MGWETFDKRKSKASDMTVSVFKTKKLSLSEAVVKELKAEYVELLYDKVNKRMALRPSTEDSIVAYAVRQAGKQRSWSISLISFINFYDLDDIVGKRYQVEKEGELVVIDLNKPIGDTK